VAVTSQRAVSPQRLNGAQDATVVDTGNGIRAVIAASEAASLSDRRPAARLPEGVEVTEQELGIVTAQLLYRLRCECGRPWFDIDPPQIVNCPSCGKMAVVRK
jgi:rubrerythrin